MRSNVNPEPPGWVCECGSSEVVGYQKVTTYDRLYLSFRNNPDKGSVEFSVTDAKWGDIVDTGPVEFYCASCHEQLPQKLTSNWEEWW